MRQYPDYPVKESHYSENELWLINAAAALVHPAVPARESANPRQIYITDVVSIVFDNSCPMIKISYNLPIRFSIERLREIVWALHRRPLESYLQAKIDEYYVNNTYKYLVPQTDGTN